MSSSVVPGPRMPVPRPRPVAHRPAPLGTAVQNLPVGGFTADLLTGRSRWSDRVVEMHGFVPGEIVPSIDLMLSHVHPEDRERVAGLLATGQAHGGEIGSMHRIVDALGRPRVLSLAGRVRESSTSPCELVGYMLDITEPQRQTADRAATAAIAAAAASRATIEQAKGILMALRAMDDDEAFAALRRRSNDTNVPLRDVAGTLVERARTADEPAAVVDEFARG